MHECHLLQTFSQDLLLWYYTINLVLQLCQLHLNFLHLSVTCTHSIITSIIFTTGLFHQLHGGAGGGEEEEEEEEEEKEEKMKKKKKKIETTAAKYNGQLYRWPK